MACETRTGASSLELDKTQFVVSGLYASAIWWREGSVYEPHFKVIRLYDIVEQSRSSVVLFIEVQNWQRKSDKE